MTQKGEDEIKRRTYKLDLRKRSLLILLNTPQTIEHLLQKTVLQPKDFLQEVKALLHAGFVDTIGDVGPNAAAPPALAKTVTDAQIHLLDDIILSEAKFLLTNFSVDSFGTQSQALADSIRACKSVSDLRPQVNAIAAKTEMLCPAQLPTLIAVILEINATA